MIIKLAFEQFPASDYAKKGGKKACGENIFSSATQKWTTRHNIW